MLKIITLSMCLVMTSAAWASTPKTPPKTQTAVAKQAEKFQKTDLSCIINKTGVVMYDNLNSLVADAVGSCVADDGPTLTYMKKLAQTAPQKKGYKVTKQDLQSIGTLTREVYTNMAVQSIELCAGMEKNTPKECLSYLNTLTGQVDLP